MEITSIKQQAKLSNRYSIFVDGEYSFSLSETALLDSQLTRGQQLSREEVDQFKRLSSEDKLYAQTLRYVAMRLRSEWEVEQYLVRKQASPALITIILNKLSKLRLLDDEAYAEAFVRDRLTLRASSRRKIFAQLKQRHVASEVIEKAFQKQEVDDRDALQTLVERKRRQAKYQDDQKLLEYLARQGFRYDDIKNALDR